MPPNSRRSICRIALPVIALGFGAAPVSAQARPTDALAWLAGCWEWRSASGAVQEHWSSATGGMLLGFSRTIRRDTVREYEFVRIYGVGDTLVYEAQPSRQPRAEFRAVPPFEPEIVFENPTHDFPQRIKYRRVGDDSLLARIEGTRSGQTRGSDFRYARVRCP